MNDLSPETRSLLTAARAGGVPTAARRHHIKHAVLLRAAAVTAVSAGASTAGATSVTAKLVLAGVFATVVSGGAFGVWKLHTAHKTSITSSAPAARRLPVEGNPVPVQAAANERSIRVPSEQPRANPSHEQAREPGRAPAGKTPVRDVSRAVPTISPTPPLSPEKGLTDEVAQLRRAHEAIRDGKPTMALKILADYDREFPQGVLTEEREAIAAIATCQARPGESAKAQARSFLRRAPGSLLDERVRAACFPGPESSPRQQRSEIFR